MNKLDVITSCDCDHRVLAPAHHDRLLRLEFEPFEVLAELIDMAATWGEVEFGLDEPVIGPPDWLGFVEQHHWDQPDRVLEVMLGLWSTTTPRYRDSRPNSSAGAGGPFGSVVAIGQAPSLRTDRSA